MHEKIYKAFHQDISIDDYKELDELKKKFEGMKPFNEYEKDGLKSYDDAFLVRFTYESNAIEGSTLSLGDTELVFRRFSGTHQQSDVVSAAPFRTFRNLSCPQGCRAFLPFAKITPDFPWQRTPGKSTAGSLFSACLSRSDPKSSGTTDFYRLSVSHHSARPGAQAHAGRSNQRSCCLYP